MKPLIIAAIIAAGLATPALAQSPELRVNATWRCATDGECRATITTRLPAGQRAWTEYTVRRARTGARPIITTVTWCRAGAACDDGPLAGSAGVR
jgi:hypothetical protein